MVHVDVHGLLDYLRYAVRLKVVQLILKYLLLFVEARIV